MRSFRHRELALGSLLTLALATVGVMAVAGPLNPPGGAVSSTYKTLTEVEPRIAINATNTPGDVNNSYRINQPGSYYLTSDLTGAPSKSGIMVAASGVTIDLNGFTLSGGSGSLSAIITDSGRNNITVRNGSISNWLYSAVVTSNASGGVGSVIEDVRATSCGGQNILVGPNSRVSRCIVENAGSYGIYSTSGRCVIESCTVRTAVNVGIIANDNSVVRDCSVSNVAGTGIIAVIGTTVTNCTSNNNTWGFDVENGSSVIGCVARSNTRDGFYIFQGCLVLNNTASSNGVGATDGAGIRVFDADSRIEGNVLNQNDRGLRLEAAGNIVLRNTCSGNTILNWDIVAGNALSPIINATTNGAAVAGNTYAGNLGSTDPNANFTY